MNNVINLTGLDERGKGEEGRRWKKAPPSLCGLPQIKELVSFWAE